MDEGTHLEALIGFARKHGLHITSTCGCGQHNAGSLHYVGRAIDVRTSDKTDQQIHDILIDAPAHGIHVIDERVHPAGEKVWSGPHLHLEIRG